MRYIPDCKTDESYNQKYLNDKDKEFIKGFDWCAEMVVDAFFNYLDDLENDYLKKVLLERLPDHHDYYEEEYEMEFAFGDLEPETRKIETYADYLRSELLDRIESDRDEMIVSMIDNMSEEEYAEKRNEVQKEAGSN